MPTAPSLHYDRLVEATGQLGESHRWIIGHVPAGSRVLDVGCAGGYLASVLREQGCAVSGVELDAGSAEKARSVCDVVWQGSLDEPAFLASISGTYDRILCGDILEHLRDPEAVLAALGALLAPDGRILVSIPNVANWRLRWELARGRFDYEDSGLMDRTHLRFYTYQGVVQLAAQAGLRVTARGYTIRSAVSPSVPSRVRYRMAQAERVVARAFPNLVAYQTLLELAR